MKFTIALASFAISTSAFAESPVTPRDLIPVSTAELSNCLIYHAIRLDDQVSSIKLLVVGAKEKCRIEWSMWEWFIKESGRRENKTEVEISTLIAAAEKYFMDETLNVATKLIETGRSVKND
jgi:hypothetical protein